MSHYQYFKKILTLIIQVLKEVQLLNEQEVNALLEGTANIKLSVHPKNSKQLNNQITKLTKEDEEENTDNKNTGDSLNISLPENQNLNIEQISEKLRAIDTREEGSKILDDFCNTKKLLQNLADYLNVPNSKKDRIEILREKIIERTIGFRLRSRAIQGELVSISTKEPDTETNQPTLTDSEQPEPVSISTEESDTETNQESYPDIINEH